MFLNIAKQFYHFVMLIANGDGNKLLLQRKEGLEIEDICSVRSICDINRYDINLIVIKIAFY